MTCPNCRSSIDAWAAKKELPVHYCPFCGTALSFSLESSMSEESRATASKEASLESSASLSKPSLVEGHLPVDEAIQFTIGPYQILRSIGKGGMGEVFLAYDTTCGRRIALKRIRGDLASYQQLYTRFLKEARITSQLTHPSIIPIYAIHYEEDLLYYTMPFVEGQTLKELFRKTKRQEKRGEKPDHLEGSIPALIRIFINICQAVAYAHSKQVLHRDLKPENVIIGQFGEVLILDWGLAKILHMAEKESLIEEQEEPHPLHELTHTGRVVGTVSYMAPERALGNPATVQTDIYSLGVILYQILTLQLPFQRGTLKEFQKSLVYEKFVDPAEVAPYREVPKILSQAVKKCLAVNPAQRYQIVEELIYELANYIEGRSEWLLVAELDVNDKKDWEFQENVLIAEHMAITRHIEVSDWVILMISHLSVLGNTKVEACICLKEKGHGIGFLLSVPEAEEREHLNDGYCLWIGSDQYRGTKLLRSTVEVMNMQEFFLQRHESYQVRIEKVDNNIYFYLNDQLQLSYISHLPLSGTHVGLIARDADFDISDFKIYAASQNIMVNCLAIPDAFLANKDYAKAISEYRRIGYSFPGRAEGREALFRAGITLLELACNEKESGQKQTLYDQALQEFEKLHATPGAPLEYLGKALVYEALGDYEEEIKCLELACRRYPHHPLLPLLQEHILYRMHESAHQHRLATYHFVLLAVRHLSSTIKENLAQKLFTSLEKHWESLYFIETSDATAAAGEKYKNFQFAIKLAFWLAKSHSLAEILGDLCKVEKASVPLVCCIGDALFALVELGECVIAEEILIKISKLPIGKDSLLSSTLDGIRSLLFCHSLGLSQAFDLFFEQNRSNEKQAPTFQQLRTFRYLMEFALDRQDPLAIEKGEKFIAFFDVQREEECLEIHSLLIWAYLLGNDWFKASELLHLYPLEVLSKDSSILHFLYGCWLYVTEGKEIADAHFSGILEVSFPRSWTLFVHFISGKIGREERWSAKAFPWEKKQLCRQAKLFYHCTHDRNCSSS